jgi:hypothetical protein
MRPADGGSLPIGQTKLKNNSAALSIRQSTRHLRAHGRHHMQDPETPRLNSASANWSAAATRARPIAVIDSERRFAGPAVT